MNIRYAVGLVIIVLCAFSQVSCGGGSDSQSASTIVDISPSGDYSLSTASAINDYGTVVGTAFNHPTDRNFIWNSRDGIKEIDVQAITKQAITRGTIVDINDDGDILISGSKEISDGFHEDSDCVINTTGNISFGPVSYIASFNNKAEVIGCDSIVDRAYRDCWISRAGTKTYYERASLEQGFNPLLINDLGDVVGYKQTGFGAEDFPYDYSLKLADTGAVVKLPPGTGNMYETMGVDAFLPGAINNSRIIAGSYNGKLALFNPASSVLTSIDNRANIDGGPALMSTPLHINDDGVVVGYLWDNYSPRLNDQDENRRAFIYHPDYGMLDINDLVGKNSGWDLLQANHVNKNWDIVGDGIHDGQWHSFLVHGKELLKASSAK